MSRGEEPQPDVILDRDELEFKHYSDGTTLLLVTYLFDRPDEPETQRRFETPDRRPDPNRHERVHLHFNAILSHLFQVARSGMDGKRGREIRKVRQEGSLAPGSSKSVISLLEE